MIGNGTDRVLQDVPHATARVITEAPVQPSEQYQLADKTSVATENRHHRTQNSSVVRHSNTCISVAQVRVCLRVCVYARCLH